MILYVTRDIERALAGLSLPGFSIMTNATPFAKQLAKTHQRLHLVDEPTVLDTWQLLSHDSMRQLMKNAPDTQIVVFKNSTKIERICKENDWTLLNPSATLSNHVEQKISQIHWLGALASLLPAWHIAELQDVSFEGTAFILQFNSGHTGTGTHYITSQEQLSTLQAAFPKREVRIVSYIDGPVYTNNNVITDTTVIEGNVNYQITGLSAFTDNPFATIGNDWALPQTALSIAQRQKITAITQAVGNKLQADGWRGLFGLDMIIDRKTNDVFLLEINARQPASVTYESTLQQSNTTFEAHLLALQHRSCTITTVTTGAQLVLRHQSHRVWQPSTLHALADAIQAKTLIYRNQKPGSDALRMMFDTGVMESHGTFNHIGNDVVELIGQFLT